MKMDNSNLENDKSISYKKYTGFYNENLKDNKLETKDDLIKALLDFVNPLVPFLKHQKPGHLHLGTSGSLYDDNTREAEAFLRTFWGIGPLSTIRRDEDHDLIQYFVNGLKEGTDPESDSYYGNLHDYDQRAVEMASVSLLLMLSKDIFWDSLGQKGQDNLYNWLMQINEHTIPDTNWLFFRVLVNVAMKKCGRKPSEEMLERDLNKIDEFYLEDGWYFDGVKEQIDYYIPFGMHYYGLLYAKVMEEEDPERSKKFKERARVFAQDFKNWFSKDGAALPFGRSQTYRFAQCSFWCALAFADVEALPWGVMKGIVMRNLRYWFNQELLSSDGLLTIGYGYQNLNMAEGYNAPGSPYWAFKAFLPLSLPYDHPFWTAQEEELPFDEKNVEKCSRMIVCHNKNGKEVQAFTSGQHAYTHTHADAKYEKFVYSTTFGFSVPKARVILEQGAYDSALALSECDGYYRTRHGCESYEIHEDYTECVWKPWNNVTVKSFIVPAMPWHIRIHVIDTERPLDTAEGGFSAPAWIGKEEVHDGTAFYKFNECITGVKDLSGLRKGEIIYPEPNTNILYPRTIIPTLTARINPGRHVLCCAVLGAVDEGEDFNVEKNPSVALDGDYALINVGSKEMRIKIK